MGSPKVTPGTHIVGVPAPSELGPRGATGATGAAGAVGAAGAAGAVGPAGPIGPSGGPIGPAGPMGPMGFDADDPELPYMIPGAPGPPGAGGGGGGGDLNAETHLATILAPVNASFGWVNQGASTITDNTGAGGGVVLVGEGVGNAYSINARTLAAPATPYTITAFLLPMILMKGFLAYGLLWRNVAGGTLAALEVRNNGTDGPLTVRSSTWNSPTSFAADYVFWSVAEPIRWLRIQDDGANRICSVSADGVTWLVIHTVARTDFLTPDQVGFFVSGRNQGVPNFAPIARLQSWKVT